MTSAMVRAAPRTRFSRRPGVWRVEPGVLALWLIPLSTLAVWPGAHIRFVAAKALVVALAVAIGVWARPVGRLPRVIVWLAGAGAIALVVATILSPDPAYLGRWPRHEGLLVLPLYAASGWLGARLLGPNGAGTDTRSGPFRRALSVTIVLLALASVLEAVGWSLLATGGVTRPGALLGNATDQGIIGLIAVAVLAREALSLRKPLITTGALAGVLTVVLSGSRSVLLAAFAVVVIQLVLARRGSRGRWWGGAAVLVGLVLALPQARDRLLDNQTIDGRLALWRDSWELAREHLLWGVGPGGFVDRIGAHHTLAWVDEVGVANPPDSPHNWLLQALIVGGVPLLVLSVALAVVVLRIGWLAARESPRATDLLCAVVGVGLVLLTHFTSPGTTCLTAFIAGSLVAERVGGVEGPRVPANTRPSGVRVGHRAVPALVSGAGVVLALVWCASGIAGLHLQHGLDAVADGKAAQADAEFEKAQSWRPWDTDIEVLAAASLAAPASFGDPQAVESTLTWAREAHRQHPRSTQAAVALAVAHNAMGDFERAITVLDRVVANDPTAVQPRVQRAIARFATRDVAGSREDLEFAIRLDPDDPVPARVLAAIDSRVQGGGG